MVATLHFLVEYSVLVLSVRDIPETVIGDTPSSCSLIDRTFHIFHSIDLSIALPSRSGLLNGLLLVFFRLSLLVWYVLL